MRLLYRSYIITASGYIGLGSYSSRPGDLVYILKGGLVSFVLQSRRDEYFELVGEVYIHGIMNEEFVRSAQSEALREFLIR